MSVGSKVKYLQKIYEVCEIKSNRKGVWVRFSPDPQALGAEACTGITTECWFLASNLEIVDDIT